MHVTDTDFDKTKIPMYKSRLIETLNYGGENLFAEDPELDALIEQEFDRQAKTLNLVASSSVIDPTVQACQGSVPSNVTAEGYPGKRYHGGCNIVDKIESLAIERAKRAFQAEFANVQAHSASIANELILLKFLDPGDCLLGMRLDAGGHLTHGASVSVSGSYFDAVGYGVDSDGVIDYEEVEALALRHKPKVLICGTTAYPRVINFKRFREIADGVNALLLADITHIAGLVAAGLHESPIPYAHITTMCTHKQLYGPRGGLILMGEERNKRWNGSGRTLEQEIQQAVFPYFQGAPILNMIAAKARTFHRVMRTEFKELAGRIQDNARDLAACLDKLGFKVISGGTDNHIVLVDVLSSRGVTGVIAQKALEQCSINVNKNTIPNDKTTANITSGIRIGTNAVALRRFGMCEMELCANLIDKVLSNVECIGTEDYRMVDVNVATSVVREVEVLCSQFPIQGYPP